MGIPGNQPDRYINPGELADKVAVVQVDGESVEVPFSELLAGYSRTADYTKKSQALAEERKSMKSDRDKMANALNLYEKLQSDPVGTTKLLNEQLGIKTADATAPDPAAPAQTPPVVSDDPELDALNARLEAQDLEIRRLQAQRQIDTEAKQLETQFPGVELSEVIAYAASNGFHEGNLEHAYKAMMFDKQAAAPAPEPESSTPGMSDLDHLLEAKRLIPQAPASRPPGEVAPVSTGDGFLDAWRDAVAEESA